MVTDNVTLVLGNQPCLTGLVWKSLAWIHFSFQHYKILSQMMEAKRKNSPHIARLKVFVAIQLLPGYYLFLSVNTRFGNKVSKNTSVLNTRPVCHVIVQFELISFQKTVILD